MTMTSKVKEFVLDEKFIYFFPTFIILLLYLLNINQYLIWGITLVVATAAGITAERTSRKFLTVERDLVLTVFELQYKVKFLIVILSIATVVLYFLTDNVTSIVIGFIYSVAFRLSHYFSLKYRLRNKL